MEFREMTAAEIGQKIKSRRNDSCGRRESSPG